MKFSIIIRLSINLKYAKTRAGTVFNLMQAELKQSPELNRLKSAYEQAVLTRNHLMHIQLQKVKVRVAVPQPAE